MKKILEGFGYGILGAIIMLVICGSIIGIIDVAIWIFNKSPGDCAIFVLGTFGFIIGVLSYLDSNEEEGKKTE